MSNIIFLVLAFALFKLLEDLTGKKSSSPKKERFLDQIFTQFEDAYNVQKPLPEQVSEKHVTEEAQGLAADLIEEVEEKVKPADFSRQTLPEKEKTGASVFPAGRGISPRNMFLFKELIDKPRAKRGPGFR